jgi:hypothetical protein
MVGFTVLRLQTEPDGSSKVRDVNWLADGHGYSLTLHRAVNSALAEDVPANDIAIKIARIARPNNLGALTGNSPFTRIGLCQWLFSLAVLSPGARLP